MAKIINGRVRQKAAPLAEWQNSDLESLDGEQLFVRSDVDDAVIGFKFGAKGKTFSELPYPDLTVRDKATPSMSWSGRQSGVYIPTTNGNYNGVNVNLTEGYQVLYWDGATVQKVVYPTDYTGAVFGGVIDDTYDLSTPPTDPTWYIASAGTYNTAPPTTLTETSILTWNGQSWSHIPFELEVRGEFLVADNIQEVRNITPEVAQLLVNGTYKGVTVLGYYEPGDTPKDIVYYLSDTASTDDGGSVIVVGDIKLEHYFGEAIDVRYFGTKPDYTTPAVSTNNKTYFDKVASACVKYGCDMFIPKGKYMTTKFGRYNGVNVKSNGAEIYLKYNAVDTAVMVQFGSNTVTENIDFYNTETSLPNCRCGVEQISNLTLNNVGAHGFRDSVGNNAWGMYINNSKNVTLNNCKFSNNSQSDIAIVDNNINLNILNPINTVDNGVYINFEPNGIYENNGINIIGGNYRRVDLLVNTKVLNPIKATTFSGCLIDTLRYRGADVKFVNTTVSTITTDVFANNALGDLDLGMVLGEGLFKDPYIVDWTANNTTRFWRDGFAAAYLVDRSGKDFTRFGSTTVTSEISLRSDFIPVNSSSKYLLSVLGRASYQGVISAIGDFIRVRYYDASQNLIEFTTPQGVKQYTEYNMLRMPATGGSTGWKNQFGIIDPGKISPNVAFIRVDPGVPYINNTLLDIKYINVNEILKVEGNRSCKDVLTENSKPSRFKVTSTLPIDAVSIRQVGFNTGDVVQSSTGKQWIITNGDVRPPVYQEIGITDATVDNKGVVKQMAYLAPGSTADQILQALKNAGIAKPTA